MAEAATLDLHTRQRRILQCVHWYKVEQDQVPTLREIGQRTGISTPGMVKYHLDALEEMGLVEREPRKARKVRITRAGLAYLEGDGSE